MKALAVLLAAILLSSSHVVAQTNNTPLNAKHAADPTPKVHRTLMQKIFGRNVTYSGALAPRTRMPSKPQLVGETFQNVTLPSAAGRTEGITLLSAHF